jgi:CRP-like cAMP-binding protein
MQTRTFPKGTMLLTKGAMARHAYKVLRGCLKSYVTDKTGKEHIIQFAPEGWLISDMNSIFNNVPATMYIEAIEDTEAIVIDRSYMDRAEHLEKEMLLQQKKTLTNNIIALNKRLIMLLSSTAEERYLDFMATYPTLLQRLPLKLIASYLGMTPEYLSDVRKKLAKK